MTRRILCLIALFVTLSTAAAVGDTYKLITSLDEIESGQSYMIVGKYGGNYYALKSLAYNEMYLDAVRIGAFLSDNIYVPDALTEFSLTKNEAGYYQFLSANSKKLYASNLGSIDNKYKLKLSNADKYCIKVKEGANKQTFNIEVGVSTSKKPVYITLGDFLDDNKICFGAFNAKTNLFDFNSFDVFLYKKENKPVSATLADIVANGDENQTCTISDDLIIEYVLATDDGVTLYAKDAGNYATQYSETPSGMLAYQNPAHFDQSNWIAIVLPLGSNEFDYAVGDVIDGGIITGKISNTLNPEIIANAVPAKSSKKADEQIGFNWINQYYTVNFINQDQQVNHFFMPPKPHEVCMVAWAIYDDGYIYVPSRNKLNIEGCVKVDNSVSETPHLTNGTAYEFEAIVKRKETSNINNKRLNAKDIAESEQWTLMLLHAKTNEIITGITQTDVEKRVIATSIYTIDGKRVTAPVPGLNIIRNTLRDGTVTTTRKLIN